MIQKIIKQQAKIVNWRFETNEETIIKTLYNCQQCARFAECIKHLSMISRITLYTVVVKIVLRASKLLAFSFCIQKRVERSKRG